MEVFLDIKRMLHRILTADGVIKNIVFVEELVKFAPKMDNWKISMEKAGVEEYLREKEFNTDLIYAVKGNKLIGTWSIKKKEGIKYSGAGLTFDKRRRKFDKVKDLLCFPSEKGWLMPRMILKKKKVIKYI